MVVDVDEVRAANLAKVYGARHSSRWEEAVADPLVDVVVVCTPNKFLAPISISALRAGKHVLCEKPMGRNAQEASAIALAARVGGMVLKVGFTLRFHPAVRQAHDICADGVLGPPFFIQATYGHGGRHNYEHEWRADRELAGGGELLDQGVHLLDLARWFLGDLDVTAAVAPRWYWPVAPLEDNALMLLRSPNGAMASLHSSWTMWRNRFSFDILCRDGYIRLNGLGGSYGQETLTVGRRRSEGSIPAESTTTYDAADDSWDADWRDLIASIQGQRRAEVDGEEGLAIMKLLDQVYSVAEATRDGLKSAPKT